jgi:hypothetical protein
LSKTGTSPSPSSASPSTKLNPLSSECGLRIYSARRLLMNRRPASSIPCPHRSTVPSPINETHDGIQHQTIYIAATTFIRVHKFAVG